MTNAHCYNEWKEKKKMLNVACRCMSEFATDVFRRETGGADAEKRRT